MLQGCFYVLLALGFAMNLSFTNTKLLTDPYSMSLGIVTLTLKDLELKTVDIPPTSLNFTSDAISLRLEDAANITASVQAKIISFLGFQKANLDIRLSGGIDITKDSPDTCGSNSVTVGDCDLKVSFQVLGQNININVCDSAAEILTEALNPDGPALQPLPALGAGGSSVKSGTFFKSIVAKSALGNLLGAKSSASWASDTALHFHYSMLFPVSATVDTRDWSATAGARLLGSLVLRLWNYIRSAYNIGNLDSFVSGAITDAMGNNISITMNSADGFFADLVNNNASLYFSTYIPREAGLDFDLVANDYKCKSFGLVCTIPGTNGLQVMNTRFSGLGDADGIFSNLLSNTTEDLLNRIVTDVLTVSSVKVGERRLLSII